MFDPTRSLRALYDEAREYYEGVGGKGWRQGVAFCSEVAAAVDVAQLFSPNEDADDVQTSDLKFLLVPFYQATLLARCDVAEPTTKATFLRGAVETYDRFILRVWSFALCGETAQAAFRDEESLMRRGPTSREHKILRFRRERSIREALATLSGASGELEEERERRRWCLEIEGAFLKALSERDIVRQELDVLQFAANRRQEAEPSPTREQVTTVVKSLAKGLQKREALKKEVFRPSHILPTMTVEQFGEREAQRLAQAKTPPTPPSASEEDAEADVYRARAWDDWKDDHPRGYGNSKLKPCS